MMAGWVYLPRFIDKVRLHLAGRLPPDYQANFTQGFDAAWLKAARLTADGFIDTVKNTITDGEVCDWVRLHVRATPEEQAAFNQYILNRGRNDDATERLRQRKAEAGLSDRDDITTMVEFIDADEKR